MIEINSLPIVIVSSPRTGSTALAVMLQKKLNGVLFSEPGMDDKKLNDFLRYASLKKNYILKEHAEVLISKYTNLDFSQCFLVRITRRNFVEQLVSSYITGKRNKWFYTKEDDHFKDEIITMDEIYLKEHIEYLHRHKQSIKKFDGRVDLDLTYEDILSELNIGIKSIQPKNYVELLEWAKKVYEQT